MKRTQQASPDDRCFCQVKMNSPDVEAQLKFSASRAFKVIKVIEDSKKPGTRIILEESKPPGSSTGRRQLSGVFCTTNSKVNCTEDEMKDLLSGSFDILPFKYPQLEAGPNSGSTPDKVRHSI